MAGNRANEFPDSVFIPCFELEGKISGVKNYCIAVEEKGDDIIFLRKIIRGGADGSYGIQVAKLAGLPDKVINRAKEILIELDSADISKKKEKNIIEGQINMFNGTNEFDDIVEELKNVDISNLTPMEALNKIDELQRKLEK